MKVVIEVEYEPNGPWKIRNDASELWAREPYDEATNLQATLEDWKFCIEDLMYDRMEVDNYTISVRKEG